MTDETALIEVKKLDTAVVFSEKGMKAVLQEIKVKANDFEVTTKTAKGRQEIKSMAYKVSRSKTLLDDLGKKISEDARKVVDETNKLRKTARDFLDELKDEVRKPLTEWEEEQARIKADNDRKEKERVDGIRAKIEEMRSIPFGLQGKSSGEISKAVAKVMEIEVTEDAFQEMTEEAQKVKADVINDLEDAYDARLVWEKEEADQKAEAERLEKQRLEQEEENKKIEDEKKALRKERNSSRISILRAARFQYELDSDHFIFETKSNKMGMVVIPQNVLDVENDEFNKIIKEYQPKVEEAKLIDAEIEAKEKAENEATEKAEHERQEALRPDKEKLESWANELLEITGPEVKDPKAKEIVRNAVENIYGIAKGVLGDIKEL